MIQLKSMAFENAEEKRMYDLLAIEWVEYHKRVFDSGETPLTFQEFVAKKNVTFKFQPKNELGQTTVQPTALPNILNGVETISQPIVQPKAEKAVKSENLKEVDTLADLRAKYLEKFGKKAFNGWNEAKLTELIK